MTRAALPMIAACLTAGSVCAAPSDWLPASAKLAGQSDDGPALYGVAESVWDGTSLGFAEMPGTRLRTAYQMEDDPGAVADLIKELSDRLDQAGYEILLSCTDRNCGGFDFRNRLAVLPLPMMYVDLGRFRYVSARRTGPDGEELVSFLASASGDLLFLQEDEIKPLPPEAPSEEPTPEPRPETPIAQPDETAEPPPVAATVSTADSHLASDIADAFEAHGEAVLEGLIFPSGSTALDDQDYPSLVDLAAYLQSNPDLRIALVGHTDNTGSLSGNSSVSQRRAQAVADRLTSKFGIQAGRLSVHGVGYLAPRADNRTADGRNSNRRVTAVLLQP